jgi:NitT/TauT family transport system ATP-binding protein
VSDGIAISVDSVSQVFRTRRQTLHAVDDIDLEVRDGEFVTLVGRSGCG